MSAPTSRPPGNTRVTGREQFYTPAPVATDVVERILTVVPDARACTWIEPAGGTGTFVDAARAAGVRRILSYDIEPHHAQVDRGDFLEQSPPVSGALAFGNPPFGRNNALSVPFFNHAARVCDTIAFILPRSWRKWSVTNRLDTAFHKIDDTDLNINYVDIHGRVVSERSNLRTCVQIWQRASEPRPRVEVRDLGVVRKCPVGEAEVALTIFGYACGTVRTQFERRPNTTQLYLRLCHPRALEALRSVDFSRFFDRVAYTEALSFREINYLLNEYLFDDPMLVTSDGHGAGR